MKLVAIGVLVALAACSHTNGEAPSGASSGGSAGAPPLTGAAGTQYGYVQPPGGGSCTGEGELESMRAGYAQCLGGCAPGCADWICRCTEGRWSCGGYNMGHICASDLQSDPLCTPETEALYGCHCVDASTCAAGGAIPAAGAAGASGESAGGEGGAGRGEGGAGGAR